MKMNMKAKYLTPSHVSRKVAVHKGESRIVGRLTEIRANCGDTWPLYSYRVLGATELTLTVGGIELDVDLESEVEVLAA